MALQRVRLRVTCPCGAVTSVPASASVTCECGRTWDTANLPEADLAGLTSAARRVRRRQGLFALNLLLAVGMLLLLRTSMPALVLVPVFVLLWLYLCRPWWRARRQPVVAGTPSWRLAPTDPSRLTERPSR